ncbi:hypothetical protein DFH11DRAFT_1605312 [Phellopilus nigrolimitatus]|nr:hypothetical protein DFH11DRAFT_1638981 [Phellopilus nigrolimitatus]KAH8112532.1 hypothetical protein DFH11DRAFT_1605312 [Phellopilus nigrolimitatus]
MTGAISVGLLAVIAWLDRSGKALNGLFFLLQNTVSETRFICHPTRLVSPHRNATLYEEQPSGEIADDMCIGLSRGDLCP